LLPDAGELMARGAVLFEKLGALGRLALFRERDPVGIDQLGAIGIDAAAKSLAAVRRISGSRWSSNF